MSDYIDNSYNTQNSLLNVNRNKMSMYAFGAMPRVEAIYFPKLGVALKCII